jgi:hypothetical protein
MTKVKLTLLVVLMSVSIIFMGCGDLEVDADTAKGTDSITQDPADTTNNSELRNGDESGDESREVTVVIKNNYSNRAMTGVLIGNGHDTFFAAIGTANIAGGASQTFGPYTLKPRGGNPEHQYLVDVKVFFKDENGWPGESQYFSSNESSTRTFVFGSPDPDLDRGTDHNKQ